MSENERAYCPECQDDAPEGRVSEGLDRRNFIRVVGGTTASVLAAGAVAPHALAQAAAQPAQPAKQRAARPAEGLIEELYRGMTEEQKRTLVLPWNNASRRVLNPNAALNRERIGDKYTRPQQELIDRILHAVSSGEDGYRKLARGGSFDGSGSLQGCGSHIFGTPGQGQFAWLFTGHHLTVRCDGNSEPDTAFGGPIYYGHSPDGYSQRNIFYYQTRSVLSVFDSLTEAQRRNAVIVGNSPGEGPNSVQFRREHPGLAAADLTMDQRRLVESVMRDILSPYRREDADEVMEIVRRNGGLERIHLAFYRDRNATDNNRWHFWRLEGPGFVWNYRVLPHVHTFVNIAVNRPQA